MNDVRWSDSELRNYVTNESSSRWAFGDAEVDRDALRARFRREVRLRVAPAVQDNLLASVGSVTDPEGIALVAVELIADAYYRDSERRWLLTTSEPWAYLVDWTSAEIAKAYRATAGKNRPNAKALAEIERHNG